MSKNQKEEKKIASPNRSTRLDPIDEERLINLMTKLHPEKIDRRKGYTKVSTYKAIALAVKHVLDCPEIEKTALLAHTASQRKYEFDTKEVAALTGISRRTLQWMAKNEKLTYRKKGRDYLFRFSDIEHLLPDVKVSRDD